YWLIEDLLAGWADHRYDLRYHLAPEAADACELALEDGLATLTAPGLALVVGGAAEASLEPGWISPLYGVPARAPGLLASAHAAGARFLSVVMPTPDAGAPHVGILSAEGGSVVEVTGSGWRDVVSLGDGVRTVELGPVRCTARVAWLRERSGDGWVLRMDPGGSVADGHAVPPPRPPAPSRPFARPGLPARTGTLP